MNKREVGRKIDQGRLYENSSYNIPSILSERGACIELTPLSLKAWLDIFVTVHFLICMESVVLNRSHDKVEPRKFCNFHLENNNEKRERERERNTAKSGEND